ncbi:neuraminidase-like domain-containing protein [Dactylosporangium sp. CA-139066]|uniref:Tc toxin subunit A-related protein n=1 Tax=Dactylosporangium sp. CA-139066 TaxID=3239930 RepID=UPI003D90AB4C
MPGAQIADALKALHGMPVGRRRTMAAARALRGMGEEQQSALTTATAIEALLDFQRSRGLAATGTADDATVARVAAEVVHHRVASSKSRTAKVQALLDRIGAAPAEDERAARTVGESTTAAVRQFQEAHGLAVDGLIGDKTLKRLKDAALAVTLSSKRQQGMLQRKLLRAAKIRGLDIAIDQQELRAREAGATTQAAVAALQASFGLPVTGTVDTLTFERISSVAASRRAPAATVARPDPADVRPVNRVLRLNMTNKDVPGLQRALAFVGHAPVAAELKAARFGGSTRAAVLAFQRASGLPQSGAADGATLRALNRTIRAAAPGLEHPYRIRGSVRDTAWQGRSDIVVELAYAPAVGEPVVLATRHTLGNGFYDLPYSPPVDPRTGSPFKPLDLRVRFLDPAGEAIGTKQVSNPTQIAWVNFTEGPYPYRGTCLHDAQLQALRGAGVGDVGTLVETADRPQVSRVAQAVGMAQDDLMRLILAQRAARLLGGELDAAVCFAFLAQCLPSNLPDNLLAQTHEWTLIDQLTDLTAAGIAGLEPGVAAMAFDAAVGQNLVPVTLAARRAAILDALAATRRTHALDRPLLVGNGTLRATLERTTVPPERYGAVADLFTSAGGLGPRFWETARAEPDRLGGPAAVGSLERGVEVGLVAKNFEPMLDHLDGLLADPGRADLATPRDLAKLAPQDWTALVSTVGAVPPGTDGADDAARRATYARTMQAQANRLFPTVALTAAVKRSGAGGLDMIDEISTLVDDNPDFDLRTSNVETFLARNDVSAQTPAQLRVMQRVQRISPAIEPAVALLDNGIHSSAQIVSMGRDAFVGTMRDAGVDEATAGSLLGHAELQYAQVLQRLGEFRAEVQSTLPAALSPMMVSEEVRTRLLADVPDLELLFGALDACDCPHCASVYGPAAYLADLLRFLDHQAAAAGGGTVREVLSQRRPDITRTRLDCANTETALPFIDLTNEILEAAVPGSAGRTDLQTTRPADELRAAPEHVDEHVYDILRMSDVPISSAYDLWNDQSRTLLEHVGAPRWRIMELFGTGADGEPSADVCAEHLGISDHEGSLIIGKREAAADQSTLWGFDATRTSIPVLEVMERTKLTYNRLQLLLQAQWITPAGAARVHITRPADSADLRRQTLDAVTPVVLDRVHRLLRLQRYTPWDFWELDLLLRAERIGNGTLDVTALTRLRAAVQLRERLGVGAEELATWFGLVPTTGRPSAADPTDLSAAAPSAYATAFLVRVVAGRTDPGFDPQPDNSDLVNHRPALLAALAVSDDALSALLRRTGTQNRPQTLSALLGWAGLARALRMDIAELLLAADLIGPVVADPFAGPAQMLRFLDRLADVRAAGPSLAEQDYLFNARPLSPFAPDDDAVRLALEQLRESLRTAPGDGGAGQVYAGLAAATRLEAAQVRLLLDQADATGPLLAAFTDAAILARGAGDGFAALTPDAFPRLFEVYRRVLKMAAVVRALGLDTRDLAWLVKDGFQEKVFGLRLALLPVTAGAAASPVPGWIQLLRWVRARQELTAVATAAAAQPGTPAAVPDATVQDLLTEAGRGAGADVDRLRAIATRLTGIDRPQLAALDHNDAGSYLDMGLLLSIAEVARLVRRVGVPAQTLQEWSQRDTNAGEDEKTIADEVTAAVKAKYDRDAWLAVLTPMQDTWRERKRDALMAFLMEHAARTEPETVPVDGKAQPNLRRWTSADDLMRYFLIDVEMSSCALTSRVKQAIGSVQMFVQRALLNLEKPRVVIAGDERADLAAPNSWRQWKWLKSYPLWEANRKIFLYPENWIDPQLRDDKTPFFVELEQEILRGDITAEACETALRGYLAKLDEVANLEVVGVHHEIDDEHPGDDLGPSINRLHVVGRTRGEPHKYFYRAFDLNAARWSAWEPIGVDINAEQVLPVVYNRALHLFWLQISEKPQKSKRQPAAQPSGGTQPAPEPPAQVELQLSWTVRRSAAWTAKQTAPQVLVHPWPRPRRAYSIKPRYHTAENQLWLDVYISMTVEFNAATFWDPFGGGFERLTRMPYDQTARAWHSSSFVFDGHVSDVRIKPMAGRYTAPDGNLVYSSFDLVRKVADPDYRLYKTLTTTKQISARVVQPTGMMLESGRMRNTWTGDTGPLTLLENGASVTLLTQARGPLATVQSLHRIQPDTALELSPFFYTDLARSYFVTSAGHQVYVDSTTGSVQRLAYTFWPFHHPYAALFVRELNRSGPDGVINRTMQRFPQQYPPGNTFDFNAYAPVGGVAAPDPSAAKDTLDFGRSGAMSQYNWELFFHIPFLIAAKLAVNQRFDEALEWFHRIFDPSNTDPFDAPQRYWITRPFFEQTAQDYQEQRIADLLDDADGKETSRQITEWRNHPFVPDVIARFRPVAYQKAVVMKYIDTLVAWGDQLFRRDTIESVNEATLLYVLAGELLGRRPEHVPMVPRDPKSYAELTADRALDAFGDAQVEVRLENLTQRPTMVVAPDEPGSLPVVSLTYFGLPANDALLGYWDTVADRLFKIRHCMDIGGQVRALPLFEPPIDPALLVRAVAGGVDLTTVLNDTPAGGSPYRYATLISTALAAAGDVRALGERMLAALERRDGDGLERLRAGNEVAVSSLVQRVREEQVLEAQRVREALEQSQEGVRARIDYHAGLPYMNEWETAATIVHGAGVVSQIVATVLNTTAGAAHLVPAFEAGASGFGGSPVVTVKFGGQNVADSVGAFARLFDGLASILHSSGGMLETQGGYRRRYDEGQFQAELARKELAQIGKQIVAAQVREAVAQYELDAHVQSVDNARAVVEQLRTRYTNAELFDWMVAQLSTAYFQAYQLAYDLARRAERALRFETGDAAGPPIIQFGYWDSLKQGLLAGDRLVNDLRRLEATALERNRRRLQATTHISFAALMPDKLLELKATGTTNVELAEWMFARENPGWINQRIVSVAVTVPCVTGPYSGVHAGLTLTAAMVRTRPDTAGGFGDAFAGDPRFSAAPPVVNAIRTSSGSNDRGRIAGSRPDDRYEPFEGAGVISRWTVELDPRDNAFDVTTVSDVVLTVEYEGDPGSAELVRLAREAVVAALPGRGAVLLPLESAYAPAWARFLHPATGEQTLAFDLDATALQYRHRELARHKTLSVVRADLVLDGDGGPFDARLTPPGGARSELPAAPGAPFGTLPHAVQTWDRGRQPLLGTWTVQLKQRTAAEWTALPDDALRHAWLLLQFEAPA